MPDLHTMQQQMLQRLLMGQQALGTPPVPPDTIAAPTPPGPGTAPQPYQPPSMTPPGRNTRGGY